MPRFNTRSRTFMGGVRSSSHSRFDPECENEYEEHSGDEEPIPYEDEDDDDNAPYSDEKYVAGGENGEYGAGDRKNKYYYRPRDRHRPYKPGERNYAHWPVLMSTAFTSCFPCLSTIRDNSSNRTTITEHTGQTAETAMNRISRLPQRPTVLTDSETILQIYMPAIYLPIIQISEPCPNSSAYILCHRSLEYDITIICSRTYNYSARSGRHDTRSPNTINTNYEAQAINLFPEVHSNGHTRAPIH